LKRRRVAPNRKRKKKKKKKKKEREKEKEKEVFNNNYKITSDMESVPES